jgi:hypothetical protein
MVAKIITAKTLRKALGPWGSDPEHPVSDWKNEVQNDETRLSYFDWVIDRKEQDDND